MTASPLSASPLSAPPRALVARGLTKRYADRVVLDSVDLTASPGRVLALVGENGAGKSTLLRLLAGREQPDAGSVSRPDDLGLLSQELEVVAGATVGAVLADALAPLHAAVRRLEELAERLDDPGHAEEYARTLDWAVRNDAWDATRRAEEAAARLGLAHVAPARPVSGLSGGERSRLALAALLTRRPACLLLDEPTNHLDDDALSFLEESLREQPGVVVVASHDRVFLDAVADQVLDLDADHFGADGHGGRVHGTTGGYSEVLAARAAARRRWEDEFATQQDEIARLRRTAATGARQVAHNRPARDNDKFIYFGKGQKVDRAVSRRVRDTERRLELLEREQVPKPPQVLSFRGDLAPGRGGTVSVRDLVVPGRLEVDRLDVGDGERVLVTGGNGSGKSTLLKALAGCLSPAARASLSGRVEVRARRVGHLPQDVRFERPELTATQLYAAASDGSVPLHRLGLLHPRDASRPVGELSVGQQRRLALAVLVAGRPDLVLLDEPTNHISLALADELEEALQASPGTVVVATHDRWLRRRWDGAELALGGRSGAARP